MANWLEAAFGLGEEAEPIAPPKPRAAPAVHSFVCVVAQPSGAPGDLGGPVAELVEIGVGVVSGVMNLESSGVEASDWRLRHEAAYHEA